MCYSRSPNFERTVLRHSSARARSAFSFFSTASNDSWGQLPGVVVKKKMSAPIMLAFLVFHPAITGSYLVNTTINALGGYVFLGKFCYGTDGWLPPTRDCD